MSTCWHYQSNGQEYGPLEFTLLQSLAAENRLSGDDLVRSNDTGGWLPAASVPNLFPELATEDDLSSMLGADESAGQVEAACNDQARPGTWGQRVESSSAPEHSRAASSVKRTSADHSTIEEGAAIINSLEIISDPTPPTERATRARHEFAVPITDMGLSTAYDELTASPAVGDVPDTDASWHCRLLRQEIGPICWSDLRELVDSRMLGPDDHVRKTNGVAWVPAGTIPQLFPVPIRSRRKKRNAMSEDDVFDYLQAEEEVDAKVTSHVAPQRSYERPSRAPQQVLKKIAVAVAARSEVPSERLPQRGPKISAPPPLNDPSRFHPRRAARQFRNPLSGIGEHLGELSGSMSSIWKPLLSVAVVLIAVVAAVAGGITLFPPSGQAQYEQTVVLWEQIQKIKQGGSQDEWATFAATALSQLQELNAQVEPYASPDRPLLQLLHKCYAECLPAMLSGTLTENESSWQAMERSMQEAAAHVGK